MVTSFIFTPQYLVDIAEHDEALHEAAHSHSIGNRVKGEPQGGRDFARLIKIHAVLHEVPTYQQEERDHSASGGQVKDILGFFRKFHNQKVDEDMPS
jgi:hypothetical protein